MFLLLGLLFLSPAFAADFTINPAADGCIEIFLPDVPGKYKVQLATDKTAVFDLKPGMTNRIPLSLGDGEYTVKILENIEGSRYRVKKSQAFPYVHTGNALYRTSHNMVDFQGNREIFLLSKNLTRGARNEYETFVKLHRYVTETFRYNHNTEEYRPGYRPDLSEILKRKEIICYDYSTLLAALARTEGISTRVVLGTYAPSGEYHAWNEVFLYGKWRTVDPTIDANRPASSLWKDESMYLAKTRY